MSSPRLFLCGDGVNPPRNKKVDGLKVEKLNTEGSDANVHIQFNDISDKLFSNIPDRLLDFLEVAAYVYTADCATKRGTGWLDQGAREKWDRKFEFVISVRDLAFWNSANTKTQLSKTLSFISNDDCTFSFIQRKGSDQAKQLYFEWDDHPVPSTDKVVMFSGGLDSLSGALKLAAAGESLILVSHRPVSTMDKRQKDLVKLLRDKLPVQIMHVPVWINKNRQLSDEPSQRTRSFLFAALGTLVASAAGLRTINFFENGVLSLNLPLSEEILRARASRTTHPQTIALLAELCSTVVGEKVSLENPFLFSTKAEIVSTIAQCGHADLIGYTKSCSHTIHTSKTQWHCGACSQCIDRRVAILAAQQDAFDNASDYVTDVFTGERKDGYDKNIAIAYCRHATELNSMSSQSIAERFQSELARATRGFPNRTEASESFVAMHERHAATVYAVLQKKLQEHSSDILSGNLEESSMLSLISAGNHKRPLFHRYFDRISDILSKGIPASCRTTKPANEPILQELCDGILKGADERLSREFPYIRWSFAQTKPDFSSDYYGIWIEIKYIRKTQSASKITDAISSDLTKYGDNEERVLFVVYDPERMIVDDEEFLAPIRKRPLMGGVIIR